MELDCSPIRLNKDLFWAVVKVGERYRGMEFTSKELYKNFNKLNLTEEEFIDKLDKESWKICG